LLPILYYAHTIPVIGYIILYYTIL
jgi:hypothetical protein